MVSNCATETGGVVNTTFDPASQTVTSGTEAFFTETISVTATPEQQGMTYECQDWATIDGEPMVDEAGELIVEEKTITVPDTTPPEAACTPTNNPAGNTIPPAGTPTGNSGQNPDGFYELTGTDVVDPSVSIFLTDSVSGEVFGPFESGTKIKLVQAPGVTPNQKPGAGDIDWMITIQGDAVVTAVDASGNVSEEVTCLVPPPPR
jgi:hypothetical protein